MITALIFDCDGTLTNSMPLHYRAWRQVLNEIGVEFSETTFYELAGMPGERVLNQIAEDIGPDLAEQTLRRRESIFIDLLEEVDPIASVVEIARQNRGAKSMAVASGSIRDSVHRQLLALGIFDWFGAIVTAEDTERHKPDPDVFLAAAEQLGVRPEECRVYEDSELGLEAARRAGMEGVDVRPWYRH